MNEQAKHKVRVKPSARAVEKRAVLKARGRALARLALCIAGNGAIMRVIDDAWFKVHKGGGQ